MLEADSERTIKAGAPLVVKLDDTINFCHKGSGNHVE